MEHLSNGRFFVAGGVSFLKDSSRDGVSTWAIFVKNFVSALLVTFGWVMAKFLPRAGKKGEITVRRSVSIPCIFRPKLLFAVSQPPFPSTGD